MATEIKKDELTSADTTVKELQDTIDSLPRTDHMTLPAIQVVVMDEDTVKRSEAISKFNRATDPKEVVTEDGRTKQQVQNEFEFGVTNLGDEAGKHKISVSKDSKGSESITIQGASDGEKAVVIKATPPNIASIDVAASKNTEIETSPTLETTSKVTSTTESSFNPSGTKFTNGGSGGTA